MIKIFKRKSKKRSWRSKGKKKRKIKKLHKHKNLQKENKLNQRILNMTGSIPISFLNLIHQMDLEMEDINTKVIAEVDIEMTIDIATESIGIEMIEIGIEKIDIDAISIEKAATEMKEEIDIEKIDIEMMVIEMRGEGIREEESAVDKFYQKFKLMATGNFFKGTTHDQDARFANKERKMLNSMDWPE